jgi:hypothetical protein
MDETETDRLFGSATCMRRLVFSNKSFMSAKQLMRAQYKINSKEILQFHVPTFVQTYLTCPPIIHGFNIQ